jgi:hypothetical protein
MYCPNRWVLLDRLSVLDKWAVGKTRTSLATARAVSRALQEPSTKWVAGSNYDLDPGDFTVSGSYDPAADELEEKVYIECSVSIGNGVTTWSDMSWLKFKRMAVDVVCHEQLHSYRHRSRNFAIPKAYEAKSSANELEKEKIYLKDPDEIECYSHNIASELLDFYGHIRFARKYDWTYLIQMPPPDCPSIHLWAYGRAHGRNKKLMASLMSQTYKFMDEIHHQYQNYLIGND